MTNPPEKRRWLNTEIPVWGVMTILFSVITASAAYFISLEYRIRAVEAESIKFRATYENVGKMVWQVSSMADELKKINDNLKSINQQSMDIWQVQRQLEEINCRTGGRCEHRR